MLFLFLFLLMPSVQAQDTTEWRLDKDKEGVRIYTRKVGDFPVRQFRTEAETVASTAEIDSLLRNVTGYSNWMPDVEEAVIVKRISENTYIYRMQINTPALITDRDLVAQMTFTYPDKNTLRITYENKPDLVPTKDGYVRMSHFEGYWEFTRLEGKTVIRNQFLSDPSGSIPKWVINSFMASNPFHLVLNLIDQVE